MNDLISRQAAIDALWKALYNYEDKTEKQFIETDELDVGDWIQHRIFVQNMSDIDRQTITDLPSAQLWIPCSERLPKDDKCVLITCKWDDVEIGWYNGEWNCEHCVYDDSEIVAWMPLPEPYKEGEQDG